MGPYCLEAPVTHMCAKWHTWLGVTGLLVGVVVGVTGEIKLLRDAIKVTEFGNVSHPKYVHVSDGSRHEQAEIFRHVSVIDTLRDCRAFAHSNIIDSERSRRYDPWGARCLDRNVVRLLPLHHLFSDALQPHTLRDGFSSVTNEYLDMPRLFNLWYPSHLGYRNPSSLIQSGLFAGRIHGLLEVLLRFGEGILSNLLLCVNSSGIVGFRLLDCHLSQSYLLPEEYKLPTGKTAVGEGGCGYDSSKYNLQFSKWAGCPPATAKGLSVLSAGLVGLALGCIFLVISLCFSGNWWQLCRAVACIVISMLIIHWGVSILLS